MQKGLWLLTSVWIGEVPTNQRLSECDTMPINLLIWHLTMWTNIFSHSIDMKIQQIWEITVDIISLFKFQNAFKCDFKKVHWTNKMNIKYERERSERNNAQGTRGQAQGVWVSDKTRGRGSKEGCIKGGFSIRGSKARGGYLWYLGLENMWWSRQGLGRKMEKEREREGCLGEEK